MSGIARERAAESARPAALAAGLRWGLVAAALTVPAFAYILSAYITLDFWWDEVLSLNYFIFVPLQTIVTDYHLPNNHIFANVLSHLYLSALGVENTHDLLDETWKLRVLMLLYATVALVYAYRSGRAFFSPLAGALAAGLLATTLPFLNFAVQVRGYILSVALMGMVLFYGWRYYERGRRRDGAAVVVTVALLLYTIPSNLYPAATMGACWLGLGLAGRWLNARAAPGKKLNHGDTAGPEQENMGRAAVSPVSPWYIHYRRALMLAALIAAGALLALLAFLPVLKDVIDNPYVKSTGSFNGATLTTLMPQALADFVAGRWLLLPLALLGLVLITRAAWRREEGGAALKCLLLLALLVVPFVLSAIRGDLPFDRTFIALVLPAALLGAVALARLVETRQLWLQALFLAAVAGYSTLTLFAMIGQRDEHLRQDLEGGGQSLTIFYSYHQQYFTPARLMDEFMRQYDENAVLITARWGDKVAMVEYMFYNTKRYEKKITEWHKTDELNLDESWLQAGKPLFVITADARVPAEIAQRYPQLQCERITSPGQFGLALRCETAR